MAAPYPQVVLFGDSLFQGASALQDGFSFQAALQAHCIRRYDVINRGYSGYNTSQALKALPEIFPAGGGPKLAYLIVLLGANDAALEVPENSQHVDVDKYEEYLTAIVTHPHITAHAGVKILLVTPPPLDEMRVAELDVAAGYPHALRRARISAAYAEAARRVAAAAAAAPGGGIVLIDLWKALMDVAVAKTPGFDASLGGMLGDPACGQRGHLEHLLPDGLHMSGEAYRIFFDAVLPHVGPEHPGLTTEGWVFPEWRTAPWLR